MTLLGMRAVTNFHFLEQNNFGLDFTIEWIEILKMCRLSVVIRCLLNTTMHSLHYFVLTYSNIISEVDV